MRQRATISWHEQLRGGTGLLLSGHYYNHYHYYDHYYDDDDHDALRHELLLEVCDSLSSRYGLRSSLWVLDQLHSASCGQSWM
jgi:hypothetical protein